MKVLVAMNEIENKYEKHNLFCFAISPLCSPGVFCPDPDKTFRCRPWKALKKTHCKQIHIPFLKGNSLSV